MDDLVLIPVHTKPEDSLKELDELHDVVEDIRKKWKTDVSFMFWLKNSDQFSCICIEPIQHNSCFKGRYSKLKKKCMMTHSTLPFPQPACVTVCFCNKERVWLISNKQHCTWSGVASDYTDYIPYSKVKFLTMRPGVWHVWPWNYLGFVAF